MKLNKYLIISIVLIFGLIGCSAVQEAVDKKVLEGTVGEKYTDVIYSVLASYGELLISSELADGSKLYIHVYDYESSRVSWLGLFGDVEHSYRIHGFKVKDEIVNDWAYGLYNPGTEYTHIFGFVLSYDASVVLDKIKNDYEELIKTSADKEISSWK